MRTFLAIEIEDFIKDKISETQEIIHENDSANIKFVEKENIHLTLKFFGEIDENQITKISKIVSKTIEQYNKYPLKIVNVGAFPNTYRPRVIWTGIKDKNVTSNLIKELDGEFCKIGFKKEKNYVPHITIGRVKKVKNKDELHNTLNNMKKHYHGKMEVKRVCLKSSKLTPDGPIYEDIEIFEFGDNL